MKSFIITFIAALVASFGACTKSDECRNYETITVPNAVTDENETHRAGWCTGTIVCDDHLIQVEPFKAAYGYGIGPCNRGYLKRYDGNMPSNCRSLKLELAPICLEGQGGPGGPTIITGATVGATSGGDWPLVDDGIDDEEGGGEGGSQE